MRTGLHCNSVSNPQAILSYYRRLGPAARGTACKLMEFDVALERELKAMGVVLIGRDYRDPQDLDDKGYITHLVNLARQHPDIRYWESFNESFQDGRELEKYSEYELARMQRFDREFGRDGPRCLIGNFSTGKPDIHEWPRFRPALEYAEANGHALGLHEYSGPFMQWMTGENQWDHDGHRARRVDDPCTGTTVEGWLDLRYRQVYRLHFTPWGIGDLDLFITEGGVDDVNPRPGPQGKGYKDYVGTEWERIPGIGNYAQQRRWYMGQVSRDKQVKGVVDFGFLTRDPTWGSFDLSTDPSMLEQVLAAEAGLPAGHYGDQEAPPPMADFATDLRAIKPQIQEIEAAPGHALWDRILRDGFVPLGSEKAWKHGGVDFIVQRAAHPKERRPERTYYVKVNDWGNTAFIEDRVVVPFTWPVGEPEAELHGTGLPRAADGRLWVNVNPYNHEYDLDPAGPARSWCVHPGIDLNLPGEADYGANVYAVGDGVVVYSSTGNGSWGQIVMIRHDGVPGYGQLWSQYAHLKDRLVNLGQTVKRGQLIGHCGNAEGKFGSHLHFELRRHELPGDAWPASGSASLALQHQRVLQDYIDPIGILGSI